MKERITVSIDKELLSWLDSRINSKVFANRSHGFEFLIFDEKDNEKAPPKEMMGHNEEAKAKETNSNELTHNEGNSNQRINETIKSYSAKKIPYKQKSDLNENNGKKRKNNED